jgi:hypothetical protein
MPAIITSHVAAEHIESGTYGFRVTQLGGLFPRSPKKPHRGPSLQKDIASLKMSRNRPGDLRSDLEAPSTDHIENNIDADSIFIGDDAPQPDTFCGTKKLVSLPMLSRHAGVEHGFAEHALRQGWVKPDEKPGGMPCWNFGKSATKASMKLAMLKQTVGHK